MLSVREVQGENTITLSEEVEKKRIGQRKKDFE